MLGALINKVHEFGEYQNLSPDIALVARAAEYLPLVLISKVAPFVVTLVVKFESAPLISLQVSDGVKHEYKTLLSYNLALYPIYLVRQKEPLLVAQDLELDKIKLFELLLVEAVLAMLQASLYRTEIFEDYPIGGENLSNSES